MSECTSAWLLQTILSLIFIIPGDIGSLIDFFNFAVWMFYGATAAACIYMRFKTKYQHAERPYKVGAFKVNESLDCYEGNWAFHCMQGMCHFLQNRQTLQNVRGNDITLFLSLVKITVYN